MPTHRIGSGARLAGLALMVALLGGPWATAEILSTSGRRMTVRLRAGGASEAPAAAATNASEGAGGGPLDPGFRQRLLDYLVPTVGRLQECQRQAEVTQQTQGTAAAAERLFAEQERICADLSALLGLVRKHNREVGQWALGEAGLRFHISPTEFREALLPAALAAVPRGPVLPADDAAKASVGVTNQVEVEGRSWSLLAAPWLPFAQAAGLATESEALLRGIGVTAQVWASEGPAVETALLLLLRQAERGAEGHLEVAGPLRERFGRWHQAWVTANALHAGEVELPVAARWLEAQLSPGVVESLGDAGRELVFEGGAYRFRILPAEDLAKALEAHNVEAGLVASLARLAARARDSTWSGFEFYVRKHRLFAGLVGEVELRVKAAQRAEERSRCGELYRPYLRLLARGVPCLTVFRAEEVVRGGRVRFTEAWEGTGESARAGGAGGSPVAPTIPGSPSPVLTPIGDGPGSEELFQLQADYRSLGAGGWEWQGRQAGYRGRLVGGEPTERER